MSVSPDPQPEETTGLEPGGGVPPGETPPDSGSVNPGVHEPGPTRRTRTFWIGVALVVLVVLAIAGLFIARIADLLV